MVWYHTNWINRVVWLIPLSRIANCLKVAEWSWRGGKSGVDGINMLITVYLVSKWWHKERLYKMVWYHTNWINRVVWLIPLSRIANCLKVAEWSWRGGKSGVDGINMLITVYLVWKWWHKERLYKMVWYHTNWINRVVWLIPLSRIANCLKVAEWSWRGGKSGVDGINMLITVYLVWKWWHKERLYKMVWYHTNWINRVVWLIPLSRIANCLKVAEWSWRGGKSGVDGINMLITVYLVSKWWHKERLYKMVWYHTNWINRVVWLIPYLG